MSAKCDRCGITTDTAEVFTRYRKSFRRRVELLCPRCYQKNAHSNRKSNLLINLGCGLLGAFLVVMEPLRYSGWVLLNLFVVQLFLVFAILPHELGHAIAAKLCGLRVFKICIGTEKNGSACESSVLKLTFWRFQWEV